MSDKQQLYRSEHDSVGERAVPKDVYYGVQSLRAAENFPITGLGMLVCQGARNFTLWTGEEAPFAAMFDALKGEFAS